MNRVTFCHWYRSGTSDEMGTPQGKDGKDCTSRRYWGADVDIATGTNDLLSQGTKRTSDNQTGLIVKNAEAVKLGLDLQILKCVCVKLGLGIDPLRIRSEWIDCDQEDVDVDVMISNTIKGNKLHVLNEESLHNGIDDQQYVIINDGSAPYLGSSWPPRGT